MGALTIIADVLEVVVLAGAAIYLFSLSDASEHRSPAVMMGFAYTMQYVSNLYWIAHELMTKEAIYEFSAVDVASAGFYILFGASLSMVIGRRERVDIRILVGSAVIAAGQTGLWLLWTGAWFRDVLGGLSVWYATYYTILAARDADAVSVNRWRALMSVAAVVAALQVWGYFAFDEYPRLFDLVSGLICLLATAVIDVGLLRSWREEGPSTRTVALSCIGVMWTWSSMFLMSEPLYSILLMVSTVQMVVVARAIGGGLVDNDLL